MNSTDVFWTMEGKPEVVSCLVLAIANTKTRWQLLVAAHCSKTSEFKILARPISEEESCEWSYVRCDRFLSISFGFFFIWIDSHCIDSKTRRKGSILIYLKVREEQQAQLAGGGLKYAMLDDTFEHLRHAVTFPCTAGASLSSSHLVPSIKSQAWLPLT